MFSLYAEGNLGNCLNYHMRKNQPVVMSKPSPIPTYSNPVLIIHGFMRHTVETWQHVTQNIIDAWNAWAETYRPDGSGFNFFTCYYMKDLSQGLIPSLFPV